MSLDEGDNRAINRISTAIRVAGGEIKQYEAQASGAGDGLLGSLVGASSPAMAQFVVALDADEPDGDVEGDVEAALADGPVDDPAFEGEPITPDDGAGEDDHPCPICLGTMHDEGEDGTRHVCKGCGAVLIPGAATEGDGGAEA